MQKNTNIYDKNRAPRTYKIQIQNIDTNTSPTLVKYRMLTKRMPKNTNRYDKNGIPRRPVLLSELTALPWSVSLSRESSGTTKIIMRMFYFKLLPKSLEDKKRD